MIIRRGLGVARGGKGEVLLTGEVIDWFPPEPATQHQVNVRMRNRGEIRLRHSTEYGM